MSFIVVPSLCFGEQQGEQLFLFLRGEREVTGLILQSVTLRAKAHLSSEDFEQRLLAVGRRGKLCLSWGGPQESAVGLGA